MRNEFSEIAVSWVDPEKFHFTINFLGEIDEVRIAQLIASVQTICFNFGKFDVEVCSTGVFPHAKNPKVLWLGLNDILKDLYDLKKCMDSELPKLGFRIENQPFKPHLTIGRLRRTSKNIQKLVGSHLRNKFEPVIIEVASITIFESKLKPSGSIHIPVKKVLFG